jgi:hypothetical protein
VEIDSDSEDEKEKGPVLSNSAIIGLCQQLETCCLDIEGDCSLELSHNLHHLWALLQHVEMKNLKQGMLEKWWGLAGS